MEQWIWQGLTVVGGLFGGYLGAYMAKKGENKAIREDIEKLTRIVEEVKTELSRKERLWDLKKEIVIGAARELGIIQYHTARLNEAFRVRENGDFIHDSATRLKWQQTFQETLGSVWQAAQMTQLVCGKELIKHFDDTYTLILESANLMAKGQYTTARIKNPKEIIDNLAHLTQLLRSELEEEVLPTGLVNRTEGI